MENLLNIFFCKSQTILLSNLPTINLHWANPGQQCWLNTRSTRTTLIFGMPDTKYTYIRWLSTGENDKHGHSNNSHWTSRILWVGAMQSSLGRFSRGWCIALDSRDRAHLQSALGCASVRCLVVGMEQCSGGQCNVKRATFEVWRTVFLKCLHYSFVHPGAQACIAVWVLVLSCKNIQNL